MMSATPTVAFQCTQSENGQLTHFFHGNYHAIDFACSVGTPLYSPVNGKVVEVHDGAGGNSSDADAVIEVSGIGARNLFHWNSIMIEADDEVGCQLPRHIATAAAAETTVTQKAKGDDPLYVELVHIQSNSCVVQVGDVVKKGQLLCWSGSVGFCPEPHLHFAAYRSNRKDAATVRVRFECDAVEVEGDEADDDDDDGKLPAAVRKGGGTMSKKGTRVGSFLPKAGGWYNSSGLALSRG